LTCKPTPTENIEEEDDNADDFFASLQNQSLKSPDGEIDNKNLQSTTALEIDPATLKIYLITLLFNDSYDLAMNLCMRTHNYMIAVMFG